MPEKKTRRATKPKGFQARISFMDSKFASLLEFELIVTFFFGPTLDYLTSKIVFTLYMIKYVERTCQKQLYFGRHLLT